MKENNIICLKTTIINDVIGKHNGIHAVSIKNKNKENDMTRIRQLKYSNRGAI